MATARQLFLVFVYGTLKNGEPNHSWLKNVENGVGEFVCNGTTETKFPLIIATKYNIPFLLNVPETGHNINGEIYSVNEKMLHKLDELEDYPQLYDRKNFKVNGIDGKKYDCLIYMLKKFPEHFMEKKEFLNEYKNSVEKPYLETDLDYCKPEDLYDPNA